MSSRMQTLRSCFDAASAGFAMSPAIAKLRSGSFTIAHYKEYLRQVYFYVRENPQLLMVMAAELRAADAEAAAALLEHAHEESGHEEWALRDLVSLGENVDRLPKGNPLPTTIALPAFAFHQLLRRNPVGHLGYVYFLEFLPTVSGASYVEMLKGLGVHEGAMSFLLEHITVDIAHNRLMQGHVERLVRSEADMAAVQYVMRATATLYASMLQGVIAQTDNPQDWGLDGSETPRERA